MSPVTGRTGTVFTIAVSCRGCLAVVEVDDAGGGWNAKEVISATGAARLRDRLDTARRGDVLEREVRALFSNPTTALLLGTPELFEFVAQALGREVALRQPGSAWPAGASPGRGFPEEALQVRGVLAAESVGPSPRLSLAAGTRLTLVAVRERVLLAMHGSSPLLVPPELVERG